MSMIQEDCTSEAKCVSKGFTQSSWETFLDQGYLVIENALDENQVAEAIAAIDKVSLANGYDGSAHFSKPNAAMAHPLFEKFIDHPAHIGYAYDLYGELTKAHLTQFMVRPKGGNHNIWHPDGARALPYGVFSPILPLQIKVSYWLTDLPEEKMGNLVLLPGSHRQQYMDAYDTHEHVEGQVVLKPKAGTLTIMHSSIWHRVEPNESDVDRKNIFYAYCPSWIVPEDRYTCKEEWLKSLTRERRILMRSYDWPYANAKPSQDEFPLYLDRETNSEVDEGLYRDHVVLSRRKRLTWVEKYGMEAVERFENK